MKSTFTGLDLGTDEFAEELQRALQRVEDLLISELSSGDDILLEAATHLAKAGGKRFRPMFAILASHFGPNPASDEVITSATVLEMTHLATLYHDDVMDEAETRRGVETVNARWGNLQAILAGDFLLARASEIAASLGTEVAGLLARTIGWLCEGQIEELRHTYDVGRTESSYLASIHGKTASLYGTAARIGGLVAELDRATIDAATEYGNAFGMVFQIVDDVLDLTATADQLGKPVGHDLQEGVYTLPVLHTLAAGGAAAGELGDLLGRPLDAVERDKALAIVRSNGGVESAMTTARRYVQEAESICGALPPGEIADALRAAPSALLDTALTAAG